jgi:Na+/proline symporter
MFLGFIKFDKIKNIRDYTLGTRPFTTTVLIATTFATAISAHKTIGSVGKAYSMGLIFILSMFLIPVGWFVMARLLARNLSFFHEKQFLTLGEIMEYWYGKSGKWLTTICALAFTLGITAASSMAIGKLLHYFFAIPETLGMILALAVVTIYSVAGGIQAVAITDVFQFMIFFIAIPVACAIGYNDIGGYKSIIKALPVSHFKIDGENISLFLGMAGFALMPNADIPFIQRALASKNTIQLKSVFNGVALLMYPLFITIALIGLITYVYNPNIDSDTALFYFIKHYLPGGVVGLMITGILAIVMSTQDSFLNTTSTLLARDVFKELWPNINEKQELIIARLSCIAISVMSTSLLFIKKDIIDLIWFIANFWDPLIIVPFIGCLIGIKINKKLFLALPVLVLISEFITREITGVFDSRSFTVGVIVSAITLYMISKFNKEDNDQKVKPLPNLSVISFFQNIDNEIIKNSFELPLANKFAILTIFGFLISIFFNPLVRVPSQDSVFYLNAIGSSLCILFLLRELWLPIHYNYNDNYNKITFYLWHMILCFCLPLIYSYILVRSEYYISWIGSLILATILLSLMTSKITFLVTWLPGILLGIISATIMNYFLPSSPTPPYHPFDYNFAIYSSIYLSLAICLNLYNKIYIQKQLRIIVEHEVSNRTKQLQKALNIKREFLNNVSHEIKTPVHNITNIVSELHDQWDILDNNSKKNMINILNNCNHSLLKLCSNLLDLSKCSKEDTNLELIKNDILLLIKKISDEYQHNNVIIIKAEPQLKNIIHCDSTQILQVLRNIFDNAIKYGKGSNIIIDVSNYGEDAIKVSLSDYGQGVPQEEILNIFEPFEQSSRTKTKAGGTGLGLAICKKIIEMHRGSIWAKNNEFGGLTVYFIIPNNSH